MALSLRTFLPKRQHVRDALGDFWAQKLYVFDPQFPPEATILRPPTFRGETGHGPLGWYLQ
jgi:hypothetical protein